MRVCPNCGYEDHPMWRPNAWNPQYSYAHQDSIKWNDPELWQLIENKKIGEVVQMGPYFYWKTKGGSQTIRRCWEEDFKIYGKKGSPQERVDHSLLAMATPLTEFLEKEEVS